MAHVEALRGRVGQPNTGVTGKTGNPSLLSGRSGISEMPTDGPDTGAKALLDRGAGGEGIDGGLSYEGKAELGVGWATGTGGVLAAGVVARGCACNRKSLR